MDIRQLRYFIKTCECGTLFSAAQALFVSQQALSKSIAALEAEIGLPLFQRAPRGMLPTQEGEVLRALAEPIVKEMDELTAAMQELSSQSSKQLRIGISPGLQYFLGPAEVKRFRAEYPELEVSLLEVQDNASRGMLSAHEITAALLVGEAPAATIVSHKFADLLRVAVLSPDSSLAEKQLIHIADFKDQSLVLNINQTDYNRFLELCRERDFIPDIFRTGDTSSMFSMCRHQGYVGITFDIISTYYKSYSDDIVLRPIDPEEFSSPMVFCFSPGMEKNANVRRFYRFAEEIVGEKLRNNAER